VVLHGSFHGGVDFGSSVAGLVVVLVVVFFGAACGGWCCFLVRVNGGFCGSSLSLSPFVTFIVPSLS